MLEQSTLTQPTSAGLIRPLFSLPLKNAQIAQLVEQRIENPRVGGSIPPLGTISTPSGDVCQIFNSSKSNQIKLI